MKFRYSCVALLCAGRSAELRHAPGRRAGAVATRGDGRGDESEAGTAAGGARKEEAHLTHTQMDKKWNSIHGKTFFENANVPRLIKVELPKKSRLSFGR